MKKTLIIICLFLAVMTLHARAIQEDYRHAEDKARTSYAFGMIIGSNLATTPIDFDYDAFLAGVRAMNDPTVEPQMSEQEAMEIVETALHNAMERVADQNQVLEAEYLEANRQRPEIRVTQSGLQYEIIEDSTGDKPLNNSVVRVNYTGYLIDGSLFDSSVEEEGALIPLELVISGWTEGLMLMSPGSIYRFYIPSRLAYGREGIQGIIPPYSTLIFSVELLEIISEESLQGSLF
ncbi:MAG: FKBP-type peptidyl-prolyl cis-trans isomerase [Treponema sp.]|nr:FKBP-type peptidyl-prolyl cis-trans isomerase [Treponema sp.]MCL2237566.1 FKBP-type peptidyl-prolyl cis-trans isomerase [Treponema sp.]